MKIVHEGRGGYIELDGVRYAIEHVENGRFAIHFRAGNASHLKELEALSQREPDKWYVER